jgi:NADH-quinone oxidoreductase chain I
MIEKIPYLNAAAGFAITLKQFFTKPLTVQYPKERRQFQPRFRGAVVMLTNWETKREKCVGCGLCARICPTRAISMITMDDPDKDRAPVVYDLNLGRCCYCGYCVEACPVEALAMSDVFETSKYYRRDLICDKEQLLAMGKGY